VRGWIAALRRRFGFGFALPPAAALTKLAVAFLALHNGLLDSLLRLWAFHFGRGRQLVLSDVPVLTDHGLLLALLLNPLLAGRLGNGIYEINGTHFALENSASPVTR